MAAFEPGRSIAGFLLAALGVSILVFYTRLNASTRKIGAAAHWGIGWIVGATGMLAMGGGWALLCLAEPRFQSQVLALRGLGLCLVALIVYGVSARSVGRGRVPFAYSLALETRGIYRQRTPRLIPHFPGPGRKRGNSGNSKPLDARK